jgi:hypothetical protein
MECEKVRERFSFLLEGEMNPQEEKVVREHLVSCLGCQEDLERFRKTIHWLHSVEEVEVPEGFFSGVHEKMEDRKRTGLRPGWFHHLVQLKLPAQAVAMVAIVFLVLYLTKMMPIQTPHLTKEGEQEKAPKSEIKDDARAVRKEARKEEETTKLRSEISPEKKKDRTVVLKVEEPKSATVSIPKTEAPVAETPQLKTAEEGKPPLPESGKVTKLGGAERGGYYSAKVSQEIILRISDREKALSQLHELIKQFGGEGVKEEGNILLTSLPSASFQEFKKELAGIGSSKKPDEMTRQKEALAAKEAPLSMKRREAEEKAKESPRPVTDQESRISVRILLLEE